MSADRTDKNMNLRPNSSSWSIANMEKTRAYSLDLEKDANPLGGSTSSSLAGSAPSSSESRRRASPAHNAPTKVLVVWLESFEDHTQLPLRKNTTLISVLELLYLFVTLFPLYRRPAVLYLNGLGRSKCIRCTGTRLFRHLSACSAERAFAGQATRSQ